MRLDQIGNVLAAAGRAWKLAGSGRWRGPTVKDQFGVPAQPRMHAHSLCLRSRCRTCLSGMARRERDPSTSLRFAQDDTMPL